MILNVAKRLAIRTYLKRNWSLLPIEPNGKGVLDALIPADETNSHVDGDWKQFTHWRAPEELVTGWLQRCPAMNLAVVTGEISGLLVLDIDDASEIDPQLEHWLPSGLRIPKVRTRRGYHLYFKHPGVKLSNANKPFTWMDIRCDDGYAILPPSVHQTGLTYTWEVTLGETLPDVPADLLALIVEKAGPYQEEAVHDGDSDFWYDDSDEDDEDFDDFWFDDEDLDDDPDDDEDLPEDGDGDDEEDDDASSLIF